MMVRGHAREYEPAYSTRRMVSAAFPRTIVMGGRLPAGVQEAVSVGRGYTSTIIYSRLLTPPAQRFVIAHALAHLLFDDDAEACRSGYAGDPAAEERADAFAAELLVPLGRLSIDVAWDLEPGSQDDAYLDGVDILASKFNVPQDLIDKRIRELRAR